MKFVDKDNEPSGFFVYHNQDREVEGVRIEEEDGCVQLRYDNGCELSRIYISDIPNMIKALKAAYYAYQESHEHNKGKEPV